MAIDSRGWGGQALAEVTVTDMVAYLMEMVLGALCFVNTIKGMAANSVGGNVCGFASCAASLVLVHLSFFKIAVSTLVAPTLGMGFAGCSALFPPPPGK
jgi:hypothetical protein